ncbi:hypothetical protein BWP19_06335 [Stenotrophomonas maltophilia]|nr:hypothetical protein BWP19_06335 [Stenotrophomonas maltophilia]
MRGQVRQRAIVLLTTDSAGVYCNLECTLILLELLELDRGFVVAPYSPIHGLLALSLSARERATLLIQSLDCVVVVLGAEQPSGHRPIEQGLRFSQVGHACCTALQAGIKLSNHANFVSNRLLNSGARCTHAICRSCNIC